MSELGFVRSHQSTIAILQRISDVGLLVGTLWLSVWLTVYPWSDQYSVAALGGALLYFLLAEINGMYPLWRGASFLYELKCVIWTWFWVIQAFLLVAFVTKLSTEYSRQAMLTWF
ncbi:membrane protein, partial [Candidatus Thiomargarita nelsonii]